MLTCPFCGSNDVKQDSSAVSEFYTSCKSSYNQGHDHQDVWIECQKCGLNLTFIDIDASDPKWKDSWHFLENMWKKAS